MKRNSLRALPRAWVLQMGAELVYHRAEWVWVMAYRQVESVLALPF